MLKFKFLLSHETPGLAFVNRNLYDQLGRILAHSTLGKDKIR